jgi:hypothetical protein
MHANLDVQIALGIGAKRLDTASFQADLGAGLDAGRDLDPFGLFKGGHFKADPQAGLAEADGALHKQVAAVAGKDRIIGHPDIKIEIAIGAAVFSVASLAGNSDPAAVVHPGRNLYLQLLTLAVTAEGHQPFAAGGCIAESDINGQGKIPPLTGAFAKTASPTPAKGTAEQARENIFATAHAHILEGAGEVKIAEDIFLAVLLMEVRRTEGVVLFAFVRSERTA